MARRKARRTVWGAGELNLTAMIDVAFQLLSFFLVTAHPMDVYTKLRILRPQPDKVNKPEVTLLTIMVWPQHYIVNDRMMNFEQMSSFMTRAAALDKGQTVLIQCINQAKHSQLVRLLDLCNKLQMTNLAVVSSGGA